MIIFNIDGCGNIITSLTVLCDYIILNQCIYNIFKVY